MVFGMLNSYDKIVLRHVSILKYKFDDFEADIRAANCAATGGTQVQLQAFQVLVALLERPKDVVAREELRNVVAEDTFVDFDHGTEHRMVKLAMCWGFRKQPKIYRDIASEGTVFWATCKRSRSSKRPANSVYNTRASSRRGSGDATASDGGLQTSLACRAPVEARHGCYLYSRKSCIWFFIFPPCALGEAFSSRDMAWRTAGTVALWFIWCQRWWDWPCACT